MRQTAGRSLLSLLVGTLILLTLPFVFSTGGEAQAQPLRVVATYSIVADIVQEIGGDRADVYSMVPLGQDPHEYAPLPKDVLEATRADIIFWNGLNMELGDGWFESLLEVAGKSLTGDNVVELGVGFEPMYVSEGRQVEMNPHAYLAPLIAAKFAEAARDGFIRNDPDNAEYYRERAAGYIDELTRLHEQYVARLGDIPESRRYLVTAERAFQYVAAAYDLKEGYVWAIDTDEQGTPQQIMNLVRFVRDNNVPAMFVESNVDPRALETVSRETGVPIVGRLYSDELGKESSAGGTLLGLLQWNLDTIYNGLMPD